MGKRLVEIEVVIKKDGTTTVEGKGFQGNECLKETETLEEALGKVGSRRMKPEASNKPIIVDKAKIGG